MLFDPSTERIFTVSEITAEIRRMLSGTFDGVVVSGEISNFSLYAASGHMYFTLKDAAAAIRCVFFRGDNESLTFTPENGMQVTAAGKIDVYQQKGEYQLKVASLSPQGAGSLAVALEKLKKKMAAEGLFDLDRKRPIPAFPRCIGVVTSIHGAAIKDIFKVGLRRWPGARALVYPVPVEGAKSAPEIAEAIRRMGLWKRCDVLIVGRGGGSIEDLWAFNEEVVCRAAADCPIPVVSAVGHEKDVTLLDLVADARAATPSNAAEMVFPEVEMILADVRDRKRELARELRRKFTVAAGRLDLIKKRRWWNEPRCLLDSRKQRLDRSGHDLSARFRMLVAGSRLSLNTAVAKLHALSPQSVLARGYAMLTDDMGRVIRKRSQALAGKKLTARVSDGSFGVSVDPAPRTQK